jgi:hypothetical protein
MIITHGNVSLLVCRWLSNLRCSVQVEYWWAYAHEYLVNECKPRHIMKRLWLNQMEDWISTQSGDLNAMGDITSMMSENWGDKRMYSHSTNDISWYNQDRAWVMPSRVPRNDTLYYQKWPTTSHGSNRTLKLWLLSTSGVSKCVHDCLQYALSCMLIPVQSCPPLLKERLDCPLLLVASPFGVV